ncbi:MAG: 2OG-Fe(II) oxygenase [Hyphomicrobiales bacterium]
MIFEKAATTGALATGGALGLVYKRTSRYDHLRDRLEQTLPAMGGLEPLEAKAVPSFEARFITLPSFLPAPVFEQICLEIEALVDHERSFIPTHKKGGTVAYETIIERAPKVAALYHSPALQAFVSRIVGAKVFPTPINDQSSLSVLFYDRPGDHIGWHFDHNFYRGRHFTLLLPMVNQGHAESGLSHARLEAKLGGRDTYVATPPNSFILFEGAKVLHRVTPIAEGERRVVLSMTYCLDPRTTMVRDLARRVKDTAFFGVRALWT